MDSDAEVSADSLVNRTCFDRGLTVDGVCDGTVRFGLVELGIGCCENVARFGDVGLEKESDVNAVCSSTGLFTYISTCC